LGANVRGYLRAGVLFAHEKLDYGNGSAETVGDTTWIAGVGTEYALGDRWSMNLEYLRSGNLDEPAFSGGNHLSGVALGVKFKF
jgi:opacity protein-like surface antigen